MKSPIIYLEHILKSIQAIELYTQEGKILFMNDQKTCDAVVRNFEIIGEAIKRLPITLTNQYPDAHWRGFAGFRDVLIHQYDMLNLEEIWITIEYDLPKLKHIVESLLTDIKTNLSS